MQEPEFEKKVRVKMDELKFSPSDAVWTNVQLQIRKDRERRRPIFWFFLSGACLLLGLAVFEMMRVEGSKETRNKEARIREQETRKQGARNAEQETRNREQETRSKGALSHQENGELNNLAPGKQSKKEKSARSQTNQLMDEVILKDDKAVAASKTRDKIQDSRLESALDAIAEEHLSTNASKERNPISGETDKNVLNANPVSPAISPVSEQNKPSSKPAAEAVEGAGDKSVQTQQVGKKHPWKFGLVIAPGFSNIQTGLLSNQYANASTNPPAYAVGGNPPPVGAPTYYQVNSSTHSGFSFLAGASVQKYLSQNIYFSTGLNYHYYSTATNFSVNSTNLSSGNTGGNYTYSDAYHFIELPASLGFHLSHNKKSPLIAELGFTLSQLIQANAHQYDAYTGNYTDSNSAFSHTQIFANLGLLLNLPVKKNQVTIGPVLQYGLTNLISSGPDNPEHLFFLGFRLGISLNKK